MLHDYNSYSISEDSTSKGIDLAEERKMIINTSGKYDENLKTLQQNLNVIFKKLAPLDADGRYGEKTKNRIKDFERLLKVAFSEKASKSIGIKGLPTPAVFYTAADIVKEGTDKVFKMI
jgi:peptidoglycan hydrolase-like protein with peptidoglycan-binding domain